MSSIIPVIPLTGAISKVGNLTGSLSPEGIRISGEISSDTISAHTYDGPYEVFPRKVPQTLETENHYMAHNLEIDAINYSAVDNPTGGLTVNIGYE